MTLKNSAAITCLLQAQLNRSALSKVHLLQGQKSSGIFMIKKMPSLLYPIFNRYPVKQPSSKFFNFTHGCFLHVYYSSFHQALQTQHFAFIAVLHITGKGHLEIRQCSTCSRKHYRKRMHCSKKICGVDGSWMDENMYLYKRYLKYSQSHLTPLTGSLCTSVIKMFYVAQRTLYLFTYYLLVFINAIENLSGFDI